ncbi:DNA-methyltransferase [Mucilaginibacter pedocola]|uniref:Methyltransferase n=1 Tax=Mucilaginibacter pedocola TaxID=1792845 RepID=A0A1S9P6P7_9SPHI|nr:site-specific DNA-methyltransferase [Mucilaginibacter pedocola]OOQ56633.1 cytosine methyltransferase [Mucilaginibacter pedocola]
MNELNEYLDQVIQGDCLDIMPQLPAQSIDLILCDLPYGTTQNPWDEVIDLGELWKNYQRLIKPNGVIALTGHGLFTGKLMMSQPDMFRYKFVWIKSKAPNFLQAKQQPLKKHEDVCIFYRKRPTYNPQMTMGKPYDTGWRKPGQTGSYGNYKPVYRSSTGQRYPLDLIFMEDPHPDWVYCNTAELEGKTHHPNQKPVALGQYLVRTYTEPGQVVLDNACGSGSFLVAAAKEGRHFIGIEKNQHSRRLKTEAIDFIEVCRERLKTA